MFFFPVLENVWTLLIIQSVRHLMCLWTRSSASEKVQNFPLDWSIFFYFCSVSSWRFFSVPGCSYPCFKTASHVFSCDSTGTARAMSQGVYPPFVSSVSVFYLYLLIVYMWPVHGEDYRVQSAVNQCPRSCIHYVTPSQRIILEELLDRYLIHSLYHPSWECSLTSHILFKFSIVFWTSLMIVLRRQSCCMLL